jgi:putative membrane protein
MERKRDRVAILLVWFFFLAGALWHFLGYFRSVEQHGIGLIVAVCALFAIQEFRPIGSPSRYLTWCGLIFVVGFLAEFCGVRTGFPFGDYSYSDMLGPTFRGVPFAIGFAWVLVVLISLALSAALKLPLIVGGAFLAMLLDVSMEPAAIKLGLWQWSRGDIPLQNYLSWFAISGILIAIGQLMRVIPARKSPILYHLYLAQMFYFVCVGLSS